MVESAYQRVTNTARHMRDVVTHIQDAEVYEEDRDRFINLIKDAKISAKDKGYFFNLLAGYEIAFLENTKMTPLNKGVGMIPAPDMDPADKAYWAATYSGALTDVAIMDELARELTQHMLEMAELDVHSIKITPSIISSQLQKAVSERYNAIEKKFKPTYHVQEDMDATSKARTETFKGEHKDIEDIQFRSG